MKKKKSEKTGNNTQPFLIPDYMDIARQVRAGMWGNGGERQTRLESAGYHYKDIQGIVNDLL